MIGARTEKRVTLTGRVGVRTGWFWRQVWQVEERHEMVSGWLPGSVVSGMPPRAKGDVWFTWRDVRPGDLLRMGEQLQAAHGHDT